ncbi:MAG: response regulator [Candidatus Omnitrophica bacterium]|nr:response regulator [Candidatus Omnitrophota bacterium]
MTPPQKEQARPRILVVDDEPDFLWMVRSRLESCGFDVSTAQNATEAVQKAKAEKPAAVLLDIYIPQANGLTVLRMIRRHDKKVPIYMVTAFSDEKKFKTARRFGASGFILKTSNLQKEIEDILTAIRLSKKYRGPADD